MAHRVNTKRKQTDRQRHTGEWRRNTNSIAHKNSKPTAHVMNQSVRLFHNDERETTTNIQTLQTQHPKIHYTSVDALLPYMWESQSTVMNQCQSLANLTGTAFESHGRTTYNQNIFSCIFVCISYFLYRATAKAGPQWHIIDRSINDMN